SHDELQTHTKFHTICFSYNPTTSLKSLTLRYIIYLFFFYCYADHRDLHSFPTRRSSDLSPSRRPGEVEDQAVGPPIARSRDDTNPMRRPSDLPRISARGPRGEATVARGDVLSWPQGFVAEADDRDSLHVLVGLASMTPRRLLELAQDHPTARGCLDAIARGVSGSP